MKPAKKITEMMVRIVGLVNAEESLSLYQGGLRFYCSRRHRDGHL